MSYGEIKRKIPFKAMSCGEETCGEQGRGLCHLFHNKNQSLALNKDKDLPNHANHI